MRRAFVFLAAADVIGLIEQALNLDIQMQRKKALAVSELYRPDMQNLRLWWWWRKRRGAAGGGVWDTSQIGSPEPRWDSKALARWTMSPAKSQSSKLQRDARDYILPWASEFVYQSPQEPSWRWAITVSGPCHEPSGCDIDHDSFILFCSSQMCPSRGSSAGWRDVECVVEESAKQFAFRSHKRSWAAGDIIIINYEQHTYEGSVWRKWRCEAKTPRHCLGIWSELWCCLPLHCLD